MGSGEIKLRLTSQAQQQALVISLLKPHHWSLCQLLNETKHLNAFTKSYCFVLHSLAFPFTVKPLSGNENIECITYQLMPFILITEHISPQISLFKCLLFLSVLPACTLKVHSCCTMPTKVRRGHQISWNWSWGQ